MKICILYTLSCLALASLTQANAQQAHAQQVPLSDPDNKSGWVLNESVSDEFDGDTLDLKKWNNLGQDGNLYGQWEGRAPSQYNPANVSVGAGNLTIASKWDPAFKFSDKKCSNGNMYGKPAPITTAALTAKAKFKYGYMEMRCKAADGPVSSSFWSTGMGGEIDVFEHFGENSTDPYSGSRFHASFHDWRKGSPTFGKRIWTNDHQLGFRVADDFHVYGLEWDESYLKLFVDGMLVNCVTKEVMRDKWVADGEQMIWIDSETFEWEVKPADLKASDFGDGQQFVVDYCRVWQKERAGAGCETRTNLIANAGFETGERVWSGPAVLSEDMHSGRRAASLNKGGVIEQSVKVKPNTTYVLSAWAKSPNTNQADRWYNAFLGVKDYGNADVNTRFYFPYYHQKSLQFTTGSTTTTAVVYFTNKPHGESAIIDDIELVEAGAAGEAVEAGETVDAASSGPSKVAQEFNPVGDISKTSSAMWEYVPEFSDEFDGAKIDARKWNTDTEDWGTWSWEPENVSQKNGTLELTMVQKSHQRGPLKLDYTSGIARSFGATNYGYFEAKVKGCSLFPGACPSFWLHSKGIDNRYLAKDGETVTYSEIDVVELQQSEYDFKTKKRLDVNIIDCNLHTTLLKDGKTQWLRPNTHPEICKNEFDAPWDPRKDYHIYGVENSKDWVVWYIDGKEIGRKPNLYWHLPMHVTLSLGLRYPFENYKNGARVPIPEATTK